LPAPCLAVKLSSRAKGNMSTWRCKGAGPVRCLESTWNGKASKGAPSPPARP